jgi:uncharacterized delta-60 repeat protein
MDWRRRQLQAAALAAILVLCTGATAIASFGQDGKRVVGGLGVATDALPYGKSRTLLVSAYESKLRLTRLRANGAIDPGFGKNGKVDLPGTAAAVRPNGRILVLSTGSAGNPTGFNPILTQLLPDGSVDDSFGEEGKVGVDLGHVYDEGAAMAVLPGNRIAVAGRSGDSIGYRADVIEGDPVVMRLLPGGKPDPSFGVDGRVSAPEAEEPAALKSGPQGTIYLQDGSSFRRLIRLTRTGSLDHSFGQQGAVTIPSTVEPPETFFLPHGDFAVLRGGGVMIAASLSTSGRGFEHGKVGVLRLRPDGGVSGAYGNGGLARVGVPGGWVSAAGVAATADGRAVVVGSSQVPLGSRSHLTAVALTPAGKLDRRFGRGGRMRIGSGTWVTGDDLFLRHGKALLVGGMRGAKTLLAQVPLVRHR